MNAPLAPPLRILTYNTHVGRAIRGAVRFLLETEAPQLVVLQEVQSRPARAAARAVFRPHLWSSVGTRPASTGPGSAGTLIFARRSVLKLVGSSNDVVTPFRDPMHPERRCTTGRYVHGATGNLLDVGAVHLWTLHGSQAAPVIDIQHEAQLRAHVESARRARREGWLPFRLGDFNEPIEGRGLTRAERQLAAADLRPARRPQDDARRIDEIFAPDELTYHDYRAIKLPSHFHGVEGQHKALVVDVALPLVAHPRPNVPAGRGEHHP
jgi:endonuclease/exonuclease/phosphatase family metal-dependent hydrolase